MQLSDVPEEIRARASALTLGGPPSRRFWALFSPFDGQLSGLIGGSTNTIHSGLTEFDLRVDPELVLFLELRELHPKARVRSTEQGQYGLMRKVQSLDVRMVPLPPAIDAVDDYYKLRGERHVFHVLVRFLLGYLHHRSLTWSGWVEG